MKTCNFVTGAFLLFIFFSCKKEDGITTYQIVNTLDKYEYEEEPFLNGTLWEVIVLCYDGEGYMIRHDSISPVPPEGGRSDMKEVDSECVKVKLTFKVLPPQAIHYESVIRLFVKDFTILKKGKNTEVVLDELTLLTEELKRMQKLATAPGK